MTYSDGSETPLEDIKRIRNTFSELFHVLFKLKKSVHVAAFSYFRFVYGNYLCMCVHHYFSNKIYGRISNLQISKPPSKSNFADKKVFHGGEFA